MNIKLLKLLIFICAGLLLLVVSEWFYGNYRERQLTELINKLPPQDYQNDKLPEINLIKQPEESYRDLVERPLFIKGRRPVDEPEKAASQTSVKSDSFDWQLNGIYGPISKTSALFSRLRPQKDAKDNYRKMTLGEDLDGWKLTEIQKDKVILKQDDNEKTLLLLKPKLKTLPEKPKAPAAKPAPAKPNAKLPDGSPNPFSPPVPVQSGKTPKAPIQ